MASPFDLLELSGKSTAPIFSLTSNAGSPGEETVWKQSESWHTTSRRIC